MSLSFLLREAATCSPTSASRQRPFKEASPARRMVKGSKKAPQKPRSTATACWLGRRGGTPRGPFTDIAHEADPAWSVYKERGRDKPSQQLNKLPHLGHNLRRDRVCSCPRPWWLCPSCYKGQWPAQVKCRTESYRCLGWTIFVAKDSMTAAGPDTQLKHFWESAYRLFHFSETSSSLWIRNG